MGILEVQSPMHANASGTMKSDGDVCFTPFMNAHRADDAQEQDPSVVYFNRSADSISAQGRGLLT